MRSRFPIGAALALALVLVAAPLPAQRQTPTLPDTAARREVVKAAVAASARYREQGYFALAEKVLAKPPLDSMADVSLVMQLEAERERIANAQRERSNQPARRALDSARASRQAGRLEDAIRRFAPVAGAAAGTYSADLIEVAKREKAAAEAAKQARDSALLAQVWGDVATAVRTFLRWLAYLGMAAGVGLALLLLRRAVHSGLARDGSVLEMEDGTATPVSESGARALAHEFRSLAQAMGATPGSGPDMLEDLDGVPVPGLRANSPVLQGVGQTIGEDTRVMFGPITLTPRQLFAFARSFVALPYRTTIRGRLGTDGAGGITFYAEKVTVGGGGGDGRPWSYKVLRTGADARQAVLTEAVLHYAFHHARHRWTDSWESFRAYRRGVDALVGGGDCFSAEALKTACREFEMALRIDPRNWPVRLQLADVFRRLGRNADAITQYMQVKRLLMSPTPSEADSIRALVAEAPDLPLSVNYNVAVTFAKLGTLNALRRANRMLKEVLAAVGGAAGLPGMRRLEMLARSARAAVTASLLEQRYEQPVSRSNPKKHQENFERERRRLTDAIRDVRDWMGQNETLLSAADPQVYCLCSGVVYTASARVLHLAGTYDKALEDFREAVNCAPSLAEPYVGLAEAYLKLKWKADPLWQRHAQEALARALELSPDNSKAYYYNGMLALETEDYAAAKAAFEKADPPHPWGLFQHARIAAEVDCDYASAARLLVRSVRMQERTDQRYWLLCDCVAALLSRRAPRPALPPSTYEKALWCAERLVRDISDPDQRKRAEALQTRLRALRASLAIPEEVVRQLAAAAAAVPQGNANATP